MAILYKGYAQQKGFGANLVNVPDPSKRIREQGLQALRGMEEELRWNNKQATRVSNALEKNAALEAQNRADNFRLSQDISQTMADAKFRNMDALAKQAERNQRVKQSNIKALASLTKTGFALWQKHDAKRKEDADIFAHQVWNEHGIGWKKLQALQSATDDVWQDSAQRELLLQKLGLDGTPDDVIGRLRSLNGYKKIAIEKAHARRYGYETAAYYAANRNTKVEIGGMQVDLHSARGEQRYTVLQLLDAKRRREAGPGAPSSKMMALSGSYGLQDRARAGVLQTGAQQDGQLAVQQQWDDEILFLRDAIDTQKNGIRNVGVGVEKQIKYYAGGDNATRESMRSARARVVGGIIHGLKTNEFTWEEIRGLEHHPMEIGGAKKTFGDFFKPEWEAIRAAGASASKIEEAKVAALSGATAVRIKDEKFLSDMHELAGTNPDPEVWPKMLTIASSTQNNFKKSKGFITDIIVRSASTANDTEASATIQGRLARNEHVSPEDVRLLKPSPGVEATLISAAAKNNRWLPTKGGERSTETRLKASIKAQLEGIIPTNITGSDNPTRTEAELGAYDKAVVQYKAHMTQNNDHEAALEHTRSYIQDQIATNPLWEKWYNPVTKKHEFKGFSANSEYVKIEEEDDVLDLINDHALIHSQPYINREDLERKSNAIKSGQMPDLLGRSTFIQADSQNAINALDAEIAQIDYYNKKAKETNSPLIEQYPDWYVKEIKGQYDKFSPMAQRLLNTWNYCDVNRAACESGMNPMYTKPSIKQARSVFSNDEDYNLTDKGNSFKKVGFDITTASIRELSQFQEAGTFITVGRYSFDSQQLVEAAELAGISLDTKFTDNIQDKLFDAYFKKNGLTLSNGIEDPQERLLLESLYRLMTEEKLSSLRYNEPGLLRPEALKAKIAAGVYNV